VAFDKLRYLYLTYTLHLRSGVISLGGKLTGTVDQVESNGSLPPGL